MNLPPPLNWLYKGWMAFSHALGMVMSKIILTILWLVGFGIYGIILKIYKLFTSKNETKDSYWIDVSQEQSDLHRQF